MPVVLISGARPTSREATRDLLAAANSAVAAGLGLEPAQVYSAFAPAEVAMLGDSVVDAWPVAVVYGGRRPADRTAAALAGLRAALVAAWNCAADDVWAQWVVAD